MDNHHLATILLGLRLSSGSRSRSRVYSPLAEGVQAVHTALPGSLPRDPSLFRPTTSVGSSTGVSPASTRSPLGLLIRVRPSTLSPGVALGEQLCPIASRPVQWRTPEDGRPHKGRRPDRSQHMRYLDPRRSPVLVERMAQDEGVQLGVFVESVS